MANIGYYERLLQHPNVQAILATLRDTEGTSKYANPYTTIFGGGQLDSLDAKPLGRYVGFTQTDGTRNKSSAAGAYQFLDDTWKDVQRRLNLPDFGPHSQDLAAVRLLVENGSLPSILRGDWQSALPKLSKTWASIKGGGYKQRHWADSDVYKAIQRHLNNPTPVDYAALNVGGQSQPRQQSERYYPVGYTVAEGVADTLQNSRMDPYRDLYQINPVTPTIETKPVDTPNVVFPTGNAKINRIDDAYQEAYADTRNSPQRLWRG